MATKKNDPNKSMQEVAEFAERQKKVAWAKQVQSVLQLIDVENITTKSF